MEIKVHLFENFFMANFNINIVIQIFSTTLRNVIINFYIINLVD